MAYAFADVEGALAEIHSIEDDKRRAFIGRLQHLQKRGFPPGVNTGRGRAATYFAEHAFLLGVALQLAELSISPERAIRLIGFSLDRLAGGALAALNGEAILCEVPSQNLSDAVYGDCASDVLGIKAFDAAFAARRLDLLLAVDGTDRWAIFTLSGLVTRLSELLAHGKRPDGSDDFKSRLTAWASGVGSDEAVWRGKNFG